MPAISHNLLFNKETRCYNDFGEDVRYYIYIYIYVWKLRKVCESKIIASDLYIYM